MSESPATVPDGPGKPEKKWKKTKRFFFLVSLVVAGAIGYAIRDLTDEPSHRHDH
ncbi:MAG TPA: hypothetical protein VIF43_00895 [Patescibacteria group bacterium]